MCGAAHIDNTSAGSSRAELGEKKASEQERTEEVRSKLDFKSIFGGAIWTCHDGSIINEDINAIELTVDFHSSSTN
jgi:hypothetical protein